MDLNKALKINPNDSDYYGNRGIMKSKLGDYYGAISDYNKAIKINPTNKIDVSNRGNAKYYLGDIKGACDDWRKASALRNELAAKSVSSHCQRKTLIIYK